MARGQGQYHSEDMPTRALPPIDASADRAPEVIVAGEHALTNKDYTDELAFMEEEVVVVLNRGRERYAPEFEQFGVNGKLIWVRTGVPTRLQRKYLEVMARSQPIDIRTRSGEDPGDNFTFNVVDRTQSASFSFSVIEDKNPRGAAWLAKVIRES